MSATAAGFGSPLDQSHPDGAAPDPGFDAAGEGWRDMGAAPEQAIIEFLRRRYASAIAAGDDRTAARLRAELDRLMNGRIGRSGHRVGPELPEVPPAA